MTQNRKIMSDALQEAIKICGGRKELGLKINVHENRITYWLNHARKIPSLEAELIELETGISRYDLSLEARNKLKRKNFLLKRNNQDNTREITISERVAQGKYLEKQMMNRKGRLNHQINQEHVPDSKKQSRDLIAEEVGLGSGKNYQRAKFITDNGINALVQLVDERKISIRLGYQIAAFEPEKQKELLMMNKKELLEILQKNITKKNNFSTVKQIFQQKDLPQNTLTLLTFLSIRHELNENYDEINLFFQETFHCSIEQCETFLNHLNNKEYVDA